MPRGTVRSLEQTTCARSYSLDTTFGKSEFKNNVFGILSVL